VNLECLKHVKNFIITYINICSCCI